MSTKLIRPGIAAAMTAGRALLAAGWRYDSTSPMADYTTIRTLLHPSGREIHARTVDGGEQTDLTLTGLTLDQVAGAVTGAGLVEPVAPKAIDTQQQSREIKARYLTAGMTVIDATDGPMVVTVAPRYSADMILAYFEGVPEPTMFGLEVGVTVLVDEQPEQVADDTKPAEPDLRQRLADELHRIADAIVTNRLPLSERLSASLHLGVLNSRADLEQWAVHLGSVIVVDGNSIPHTRAKILLGDTAYGPDLTVGAQTRPDSRSEVERLREENETLRAQLAEGGETR